MHNTVKVDCSLVASAEVDWFQWDGERGRMETQSSAPAGFRPSPHTDLWTPPLLLKTHTTLIFSMAFSSSSPCSTVTFYQGCHNQIPQTKWTNATESYSLADLNANVWFKVSVGLWFVWGLIHTLGDIISYVQWQPASIPACCPMAITTIPLCVSSFYDKDISYWIKASSQIRTTSFYVASDDYIYKVLFSVAHSHFNQQKQHNHHGHE